MVALSAVGGPAMVHAAAATTVSSGTRSVPPHAQSAQTAIPQTTELTRPLPRRIPKRLEKIFPWYLVPQRVFPPIKRGLTSREL